MNNDGLLSISADGSGLYAQVIATLLVANAFEKNTFFDLASEGKTFARALATFWLADVAIALLITTIAGGRDLGLQGISVVIVWAALAVLTGSVLLSPLWAVWHRED